MANIGYTPRPLNVTARAVAVTPSDTTVVAFNYLYIGLTGDVAVIPYGQDNAVTFKSCPVGILPVGVTKVMATGTTAGNILGLT